MTKVAAALADEEWPHRSSARRAAGLGFSSRSVLAADFVFETVDRVGQLDGIAVEDVQAILDALRPFPSRRLWQRYSRQALRQ